MLVWASVKIKNLHHLDQPRIRLLQQGSRNLSDAELLAVLLNQGSKRLNAKELSIALLARFNNDIQKLFGSTHYDLTQFLGIGTVKASQLLACFELGRRLSRSPNRKPIIVKNSLDVFNHVKCMFSLLAHEEFIILLLNNNNEIIHSHRLSRGGLTATVADGRILFKIAFEYKATAISYAIITPAVILPQASKTSDLQKTIENLDNSLTCRFLIILFIAILSTLASLMKVY